MLMRSNGMDCVVAVRCAVIFWFFGRLRSEKKSRPEESSRASRSRVKSSRDFFRSEAVLMHCASEHGICGSKCPRKEGPNFSRSSERWTKFFGDPRNEGSNFRGPRNVGSIFRGPRKLGPTNFAILGIRDRIFAVQLILGSPD